MTDAGQAAPLVTSGASVITSAHDAEPAAVPEQPDPMGSPAMDDCTANTGGSSADGAVPVSSEPLAPDAAAGGEAPLSKRQRKRLAKREAFLAQRPALRRAERQRRKEKRAAAVAAGTAPPKRPRLAPMSSGSGVQVVIDLSFDDLMTERDLGKCLKQVQRCYAANRRAARPVQLILTSMEGESRRLMDANDGWQNWDVRIERDHLLDVLSPETVTYLTSDSENQLDVLQPGRAYVIGGLVDHNHHKGECLRRANEAGISHARLPIDDFVEMKTRKVLTIDHVFNILLLVAGGSGWQQALQQVLPARKGAVLKEGCGAGGEDGSVDDGAGSGEEGMASAGEGTAERSGESKGDARSPTGLENTRNRGSELEEIELKDTESGETAKGVIETGEAGKEVTETEEAWRKIAETEEAGKKAAKTEGAGKKATDTVTNGGRTEAVVHEVSGRDGGPLMDGAPSNGDGVVAS